MSKYGEYRRNREDCGGKVGIWGNRERYEEIGSEGVGLCGIVTAPAPYTTT